MAQGAVETRRYATIKQALCILDRQTWLYVTTTAKGQNYCNLKISYFYSLLSAANTDIEIFQ